MSNITVCRTCLSHSTRMHDLRNTHLQEIFEKLTSKKANTDYGTTICYICYAQLQKCRTFVDMSWKSEVILTELANKCIEINKETICRLSKRTSSFLVTPVDYYYNGSRDETVEAVLKEDTTENEVVVKEEKFEIEEDFAEVAFEEGFVLKEEPTVLVEQMVVKEEMWLEEDIDIEGEVILNEHCESESEELFQYEEYVDIEGFTVNGKENINTLTNISNEKELYFNCNMCSKVCSTKRKLKRHIKTHTGNVYTCNTCDKTFTIKNNIIKHMRTHSLEKPYTCRLCDKTFRYESYLRKHIKIHTGEKPYVCAKCGKRFTDRSSCNRHMNNHNGEKRHICNQCYKKFSRSYYLQYHMRTHSGLKPFTCNVCNKSFSQKGTLKGHMRIHTGEKTHYCSKCNKGFNRKGHLHQHMVVHMNNHMGAKP